MLRFAQTAEAIGATSSTLAKSRTLADYLASLDPSDLRLAATYMTGRPFGGADRRVLRLGWSSIGRVIEKLSGRSASELSEAYLRHSDLGDWTEEALAG